MSPKKVKKVTLHELTSDPDCESWIVRVPAGIDVSALQDRTLNELQSSISASVSKKRAHQATIVSEFSEPKCISLSLRGEIQLLENIGDDQSSSKGKKRKRKARD